MSDSWHITGFLPTQIYPPLPPLSGFWTTGSPSFTPDLNPMGPGGSPMWPLWLPGHLTSIQTGLHKTKLPFCPGTTPPSFYGKVQ